MREKLAKVQHEIWSHWMRYLFSVCEEANGNLIIPPDKVKRWKRQMITPYQFLTEEEKESDREQADKVLNIIRRKEHELLDL
jgi:hypothetical protein